MGNRTFSAGDYITKIGKAAYPSIQTMRINYFVRGGAECTTGIAGGCRVDDLSSYRHATAEEIFGFLQMEAKAYSQYIYK